MVRTASASVDPAFERAARWRVWLPVVAGGIALALALLTLGTRDLWLDEAFSVAATEQLAISLWRRAGSMGLYYVLLDPWSDISINPWWLRLPSAVFMAIACALSVWLALDWFGRRVAVTTAVLLVPMWGVTRYAQEARGYALATLLAVLSWMALVAATRRRGAGLWVLWGVLAAGLAYSHPTTILVVISQVIVITVDPGHRPELLRQAAPGLGVFAVLLLPLVAATIAGTGAAPDWVPPLGSGILDDVATMLGGPGLVVQLTLGAALIGGSAVVATMASREPTTPPRPLLAVLLWLWVTPIVLTLASLATPMLLGRYLTPVLPAAALAIALAVSQIRSDHLRYSVIAVLLLALAAGQLHIHRMPGDDWSGAVAKVTADGDETSGLVFLKSIYRLPFELAGLHGGDLTQVAPVSPVEPWGVLRRYPRVVPLRLLPEALERYDAVWVVEQREPEGSRAPPGPLEAEDEPLRFAGYCRQESAILEGGILIARFEAC